MNQIVVPDNRGVCQLSEEAEKREPQIICLLILTT